MNNNPNPQITHLRWYDIILRFMCSYDKVSWQKMCVSIKHLDSVSLKGSLLLGLFAPLSNSKTY